MTYSGAVIVNLFPLMAHWQCLTSVFDNWQIGNSSSNSSHRRRRKGQVGAVRNLQSEFWLKGRWQRWEFTASYFPDKLSDSCTRMLVPWSDPQSCWVRFHKRRCWGSCLRVVKDEGTKRAWSSKLHLALKKTKRLASFIFLNGFISIYNGPRQHTVSTGSYDKWIMFLVVHQMTNEKQYGTLILLTTFCSIIFLL